VRNWKSLSAMCCILTLWMAGCGGSSKPATTNGTFADTNVVGLPYTCGTTNAVTGSGGTYSCPAGSSSVTFSVGPITICTAPPQPLMTPVSCAQITDPTANTSTPSVLAMSRFLQSISTTPSSSGALTITSQEVANAAGMTLNFSTATDAQLQAAVSQVEPGATLVDATTAENEMIGTVNAAFAGNYAGTYSGGQSGTWSLTMTTTSNGLSVSGTYTNSANGPGSISGSLVSGTTYSGTAGGADWTGTLDTSKNPAVFSGSWSGGGGSGTFTGTKQ
jgi:hypothetical protein